MCSYLHCLLSTAKSLHRDLYEKKPIAKIKFKRALTFTVDAIRCKRMKSF